MIRFLTALLFALFLGEVVFIETNEMSVQAQVVGPGTNIDINITSNSAILTGIFLSGNAFTCGASSGTLIGTLSATQNSGSYTGQFSTSTSGFQVVGNQLETSGTPAGCPTSYNVVVNASLPPGITCGLAVNCSQTFTVIGSNGGTGNCPTGASIAACVITPGSPNTLVDAGGYIWKFNNSGGKADASQYFVGYVEVDRSTTPGGSTFTPACCSILGGVDGGGYATVIMLDRNRQIHTKGYHAWYTTNNVNNWSSMPGTAPQYQPPSQPNTLCSPNCAYDFAPSHVVLATDPAWLTTTSGAAPTSIGIGAPSDDLYLASNLTVTAYTLPTNGTILSGGSPVTEGQTLTISQLQALQFKPTTITYRSPRHSAFTFKVCDPATSCRIGQASVTVLGATLWTDPPGWSATPSGSLAAAPQIIQPSVAGDLVGMRWSNTSNEAAGYVTHGQLFLMGALKASDLTGGNGVCGKTDVGGGALSACATYVQVDVKNHWPDGSVKMADMSYLLPSFTSGQGYAEILFAKCLSGGCPSAPSPAAKSATALQSSGYTPTMTYSGGLSGTANCNLALLNAINANNVPQWLSGPVVNEFNVGGTVGGLHFDCHMRAYADGSTHTEYVSDNTWVYSGGAFSNGTQYSYTVLGSDGYTNGGQTINQHGSSTWQHDIDSAGIINPNPQIDVPYLMATGAIIPVDTSFGGSIDNINTEAIGDTPMQCGSITGCGGSDMQDPGTRPDLGPLTNWEGLWLVTQHPTAYQTMVANGHVAGHAPLGFTDTATGQLVDGTSIPNSCGSTGTGTFVTCNPRVPSTHPGNGGWKIANSHLPNLSYLSYIIRGRKYDLRLLETIANFQIIDNPGRGADSLDATGAFGQGMLALYSFSNPGSNPYPQGTDEIRAEGWHFREVLQAAFVAPDSDPLASYFKQAAQDTAVGHAQEYIANDQQERMGLLRGYVGHLNGGGGPNTDAEHWDNFASMVGLGAGMALPVTSGQLAAGVRWQSNLHEGLLTHGPDGFLGRNGTMYQAGIATGWNTTPGPSNAAFYQTYATYYMNNITGCSDGHAPAGCPPGGMTDHTIGGLDGAPAAQIMHPTNAEEGYPTEWRSAMSAAVSTLTGASGAQAIQAYAYDLTWMRYSWVIYGGGGSLFDTNCAGGGGGSPCWMQYTNIPTMPNGDPLFVTQEQYDVTNSANPTLTASGSGNSILGMVGSGNMVFNGKNVPGVADIMSANTIGFSTPDGFDTWDNGPGSVTFNPGTSQTYEYGSCAPNTFKTGSGLFYYMVLSGNCFTGYETGHPSPQPNTVLFPVDQINGVDTIERFRPGIDGIHVKVNLDGQTISTPAQFTSFCTTQSRMDVVTLLQHTDTICTLPINNNTIIFKDVSVSLTSSVQVP